MKRLIEVAAASALVLCTATAFGQAKKGDKAADTAAATATPVGAPGSGSSTQGGWLKAGAGQCISPDADKALTACPSGALKTKPSGKKGGATFLETDVAQPSKEKKPADKPVNIEIPRPSPEISGKIKTALMTEIVALDAQLKKIKPTSEKHVLIARRLAESYYELERLEQSDVLDLQTKIALGKKKGANTAAM